MGSSNNLGFTFLEASQAQKHVTVNEALRAIDAVVNLTVVDRDLIAPPGSPVEGDVYIVGDSATGDWATHDKELAYYTDTAWGFIAAKEGWRAWILDEDKEVYWSTTPTPDNWTDVPTGAAQPQCFVIAASDETTALTVGTGKVTFRMPYAFTLTEVRASVATAPTGSVLTVDINESGTSILSTKITIDAAEKTSATAATAAAISDTALADDAEITIDVDAIGSTVAGAGLKVALVGTKT